MRTFWTAGVWEGGSTNGWICICGRFSTLPHTRGEIPSPLGSLDSHPRMGETLHDSKWRVRSIASLAYTPGCLSADSPRSRTWARPTVRGTILTVCTGACLLPTVSSLEVLSGELYIPKTSARASFVANVTVGSEGCMRPLRVRVPPAPSSLNLTRDCPERFRSRSVGAGGGHFFPRSPIDRARASWMLYSAPSLKSSPKSRRSFSGRLPGSGRASIGA